MESREGGEVEGGTREEGEKTGKEVERCVIVVSVVLQSVTVLGYCGRFEGPRGVDRSEGERSMPRTPFLLVEPTP